MKYFLICFVVPLIVSMIWVFGAEKAREIKRKENQ